MKTLSTLALTFLVILIGNSTTYGQEDTCIGIDSAYMGYFGSNDPNQNCDFQICFTYELKCAQDSSSMDSSFVDSSSVVFSICNTIPYSPSGLYPLSYYTYKCTDSCNLTVTELKVRRVNTGETIILTGGSAQYVYNIVTQQSTGAYTLGVFVYDCFGNPDPHLIHITGTTEYSYFSVSSF